MGKSSVGSTGKFSINGDSIGCPVIAYRRQRCPNSRPVVTDDFHVGGTGEVYTIEQLIRGPKFRDVTNYYSFPGGDHAVIFNPNDFPIFSSPRRSILFERI